jgi:hypothetical protein
MDLEIMEYLQKQLSPEQFNCINVKPQVQVGLSDNNIILLEELITITDANGLPVDEEDVLLKIKKKKYILWSVLNMSNRKNTSC